MNQERLFLIAAGAVLIALIIAIASFSLGVYVGVHGWTAGPPSVAGPGGRQPRQPGPPPDQDGGAMPPQRDGGQPGPRPQLVGQVRSVSGDSITLDTPQGPRLFRLSAEVQVVRAAEGGEQPASLDEVVPGEHLAVFGRLEGDGARQLVAERLVLLPPPPDAPNR